MRIGIDGRVIQDHFPGIGRYTYSLIRALARRSNLEILVFLDDSSTASHLDVSRLRLPNVQIVPLRHPIFSPIGQLRVSRAIDTCNLDVLHLPYYLGPMFTRTPRVVTIHDCYPLRYPSTLPSLGARVSYRFFLQRAAATCEQVVVDSRWVRDELKLFRIRTKGDSHVVYLAADDQEMCSNIGPDIAAGEDSVFDPVLLTIGADKPLKNFPMLIDAYAKCSTRIPLVLAGPFDRRFTATAEAIDRNGVANRVVRTGSIPEMELSRLRRRATVFLFPSIAEGFGLPPLEAMASGIPVICSNQSSLPEVVGDAAMSLDPTDRDGWSAAIDALIGDEAARQRLRTAGLERAATFSWERTAGETFDVYQLAAR